MQNTIEINEEIYLNGEKLQIISGSIHYYRVVPEYWRDRLEKLKAMGCNTVETYVAWNIHEPNEGEFHFKEDADLCRFIEIAQELGLYVILRPSPYICAEWEFGGFPAWLLTKHGIRLRCYNKVYLDYVARYYDQLIPLVAPYQISNGGPILMFQIENEYGSYGNDKEYLNALKDLMVERGVNVPFVTSDGPGKQYLDDGKVEGAWQTANFGSKGAERFAEVKKVIGEQPLMCMEFWVGWFDHWGMKEHSVVDYKEHAKSLEEMLERGHVNFYMFHGGTNFGFMNGSNYDDKVGADVTSYDYDAPLTEDGQITKKYLEFQKVISKFRKIPEVEFSTEIKRKAYGSLKLVEKVGLFETLDTLSTPVRDAMPLSMEELGQNYGYVLYRSTITRGKKIESCKIRGGMDRAILFADGQQVDIRDDDEMHKTTGFEFENEEGMLDILMENRGRVNYGPEIELQKKGITHGVQINRTFHMGWDMYPLPLDDISKVDYSRGYQEGNPAFYKFNLQVDEIGDTFIDVEGFGKGVIFVNGKNIGRFWEVGPQKRLYIPGPFLNQGNNEIIVFETDGKAVDTISFKDEPDLG
ncbi:beta-galactosidase family protein [Enterococcus alcedinis]|uniref:Beta-galactosidase n=1 Tax=Enterococcus alcedinis TaxID=1274384 RepID=A0A917JFZ7_9ENTE|nr:beta-galactosidase family protein [Enterococcus alcedinis]MBP2102947.1 beta-galactosidase [Enterococcus alcedinis]GGI66578.1 beta-galactosidase [Enterococcus alcedinis]